MIAPDAPDATLCMAKNSKTNKNQQASGAKGGKRGKGELVLDLSDPADEAFDLVSDSFHTKISYLFLKNSLIFSFELIAQCHLIISLIITGAEPWPERPSCVEIYWRGGFPIVHLQTCQST